MLETAHVTPPSPLGKEEQVKPQKPLISKAPEPHQLEECHVHVRVVLYCLGKSSVLSLSDIWGLRNWDPVKVQFAP